MHELSEGNTCNEMMRRQGIICFMTLWN